MELVMVLALAAGIGGLVVSSRSAQKRREREEEAQRLEALAAVQRTAEEDVARFGEELQDLDADVVGTPLDTATRQDYQRALDAYEGAKASLAAMRQADEVKHVTEVLEDGRYALACVRARINSEPLPVRRAPCFLNPQHGPSTEDVEWAPAGGVKRSVPVCAADAERIKAGAEPDVRKVMVGAQRVPYWQGGPAYAPYGAGYFGNFALGGLLPGMFIGSMMAGGWNMDGSYAEGYADGAAADGGDGGYDGGGDGGDGGGGDAGGYDGGGGDFAGGDGGGWGDFGGGGFDFGGFGDFGN